MFAEIFPMFKSICTDVFFLSSVPLKIPVKENLLSQFKLLPLTILLIINMKMTFDTHVNRVYAAIFVQMAVICLLRATQALKINHTNPFCHINLKRCKSVRNKSHSSTWRSVHRVSKPCTCSPLNPFRLFRFAFEKGE